MSEGLDSQTHTEPKSPKTLPRMINKKWGLASKGWTSPTDRRPRLQSTDLLHDDKEGRPQDNLPLKTATKNFMEQRKGASRT